MEALDEVNGRLGPGTLRYAAYREKRFLLASLEPPSHNSHFPRINRNS